MPDCIFGKILPANPPVFYPRLFCFPKYTNDNDWYNPQAHFWRSYYQNISRFPAPTAQTPLPIATLLRRMPESSQMDFLMDGMDQDVREIEARSLQLISRGYPKPSKLQAEQLRYIQLLQSAIRHLQVAVVREDLAQQMYIYNTVSSLIKTLRVLSQFGYQTRVEAYYSL